MNNVSPLCRCLYEPPASPKFSSRSPGKSEYTASAAHSCMSSNVHPRPDILKSAMYIIVDVFHSPCDRIAGDEEWGSVGEPVHRITKLAQFSRFNLGHGIWGHVYIRVGSVSQPAQWSTKLFGLSRPNLIYASGGRNLYTRLRYGTPSTKWRANFQLLIIRHTNHMMLKRTYEPPSPLREL